MIQRNHSGFTLIELSIGAAVSIIVLYAASSVFQWMTAELKRSEIQKTVQNLQADAVYSVLSKEVLAHSISKAAALPGGINGQLAACLLSESEPTVPCPDEPFHAVLIPKTRGGPTTFGRDRFSGMGPGFKFGVRTYYNSNGFRCDGAERPTAQCPLEVWSEIQCKFENCGRTDVAKKLEVTIHYDVYEFKTIPKLSPILSKSQKLILDAPKAEQESPLMHPNLIINEEINWRERRE